MPEPITQQDLHLKKLNIMNNQYNNTNIKTNLLKPQQSQRVLRGKLSAKRAQSNERSKELTKKYSTGNLYSLLQPSSQNTQNPPSSRDNSTQYWSHKRKIKLSEGVFQRQGNPRHSRNILHQKKSTNKSLHSQESHTTDRMRPVGLKDTKSNAFIQQYDILDPQNNTSVTMMQPQFPIWQSKVEKRFNDDHYNMQPSANGSAQKSDRKTPQFYQ